MPAFVELLLVRRSSAVFTAPQTLVFVVGTSLVTTLARGARTIAGRGARVGAGHADMRPAGGASTVGTSVVNSMLPFVAALGVEKF